jgi:two-component sensor histidine kinase
MTVAVDEPDAHLASREANRRFLTTLTTLQWLLRMDLGDFADPGVREAVSVFSSRIQAFAGLHRTLGEDAREPLVDARAHLGRLCAELCQAHLAPRGLYCEFKADPGLLPRETCQKLSLIIVELVTNAARNAFVGRGCGRIWICLRRTPEGWICQVADNGSSPRGGQDSDGMSMVQGLADALDGELRVHLDAGGAIVTLSLPDDPALEAVAAVPNEAPCAA